MSEIPGALPAATKIWQELLLPSSDKFQRLHPDFRICARTAYMEAPELTALTTAGEITRLILRRPPLNFLNLELLRQIEEHLESLGENPECRLLVLDSEGPAFSTGLEMSEQTREAIFLLLERFHHVVRLLHSVPRPTLAIVRGMAIGAGNELAACCDFVFATEKSSFGQPEVKTGTIPSVAHIVLPGLVGTRRATELILTGNLVSAREAQGIGLISRIVPEDRMGAAIEDLAASFRGLSAPVMALALLEARESRSAKLEDRIRRAESIYLNQLMDLEDTAEGIQAFLEKRTPRWKNR
jgi:cyclohexa-1,5-dienecarbonyl-CoA hydratase